MIKALLKKQIMELFSFYMQKSSAKKRKGIGGSVIFYVLLLIYCAVVFFWLFTRLSTKICVPLVLTGNGWLYFAILGLLATGLGAYGSVFTVHAAVYKAKDNDTLLSMPIPPRVIILVRLLGCYLTALFMELLVILPAEYVYLGEGFGTVAGFVGFVVVLLLLPLLAVTVASVLAWILAKVTVRSNDKNLSTVIVSLLFLAVYFFIYFKGNSYLNKVLENPDALTGGVKYALFPLWMMGRGCQGDLVATVLFAGLMLALFALVFTVISRGFLKLSTQSQAVIKQAVYKGGPMKASSAVAALYRKELLHLKGSSIYVLNCAMGSLFMIVAAVALLIKKQTIQEMLMDDWIMHDVLFSLGAASLAFLVMTNNLTAPSISLEGKELWILRSMPVETKAIFWSKIKTHMMMTLIPGLFATAAFAVVLQATWYEILLLVGMISTLSFFAAVLGLMMNLHLPRLDWRDEAMAVKQGGSVIFSMLLCMGTVIAICIVYFALLTSFDVNTCIFVGVMTAVFLLCSLIMWRWLCKSGKERLEELS